VAGGKEVILLIANIILLIVGGVMLYIVIRESRSERNYKRLFRIAASVKLRKMIARQKHGPWSKYTLNELLVKINEEMNELFDETERRQVSYYATMLEAADVAIYADMLVEHCYDRLRREVEN
jgi:hypothetical protein